MGRVYVAFVEMIICRTKRLFFGGLACTNRFETNTRAREAQADALADEILDIADDGLNDSYEDEDGNRRTDYDVIARSKLRVDARKWITSKLKPRVYGDKPVPENDDVIATPVKVEINVKDARVRDDEPEAQP